jgi:hypothetical protein
MTEEAFKALQTKLKLFKERYLAALPKNYGALNYELGMIDRKILSCLEVMERERAIEAHQKAIADLRNEIVKAREGYLEMVALDKKFNLRILAP